MSARLPPRFENIYRTHLPFVWSVVRRSGVPERDVEDTVQEAFIVALRRLGEFEGKASIRTWLYAIATRVAWARLRKLSRAPPPDPWPTSLDGLDPEHALERGQAVRMLDALLGHLDHDKRVVFILAEIEGLRVPEIARIVGAKPRTVTWRLAAARQRFNESLSRLHQRIQREGVGPAALIAQARREDQPDVRSVRRMAGVVALGVGAPVSAPVTLGWLLHVGSLPLAIAGTGVLAIAMVSHGPAPTPSRAASATAPAATPVTTDHAATQPTVAAIETPPAPTGDPLGQRPPRPLAPRAAPPPHTESPMHAVTPVAAVPPPPPTPDEQLADEVRLLERARVQLADHKLREADAALDSHAKRFPSGVLASERERTRAAVLCAAGDVEAARAVAIASGLETPSCVAVHPPR